MHPMMLTRYQNDVVACDEAAVLDAARHALMLHQWIVAPDFDKEGEVQQAEKHLTGVAAGGDTPCWWRHGVCTRGWTSAGRARRSAPR